MDVVLMTVTAVCLAAAVGSAMFTWFVWREDRRRSAARVAALTQALDVPEGDYTRVLTAAPDTTGVREASGTTALFESRATSAVPGRPLLKIAIGFVMAVIVIVAIAMNGDRAGRAQQQAQEPAAAPAAHPALELVSMTHRQQGDVLTVTGLVRNTGGDPARGITAVVFVFDREDRFVASGRAPVDFVTLGAGDESPFTVTVPHVARVTRYRVSFRNDAGIVQHVDRRPAGTRPPAGQDVQVSAQ